MSPDSSFSSSEFQEALKWFLALKKDRQFYVITEVLEPEGKLSTELKEEELGNLVKILDEVAVAIGRTDADYVTSELVSFGMDETVATVLVKKIEGARPPAYVHIGVLKELGQEQLTKLVTALCESYMDGSTLEEVESQTGLKSGIVFSAFRLFRDHLIFCLSERGDKHQED